jgi:hypothetical protein
MLTLRIVYRSASGRQTPIIESLSEFAIAESARRVLREYEAAASACPEEVLATLIRSEANQAKQILCAAGLALGEEAPDA